MDPDTLAALTLAGLLLHALGGLYLAYDLLGGRGGPLSTLTRWATYTVPFSLAYGLALGTLFALVAGPALGLALTLELANVPAGAVPDIVQRPSRRMLAFGLLRGSALGASGGLTYGWLFGLVFGVLSAIGLIAVNVRGSALTHETFAEAGPGLTWPRARATASRGLALGLAALAAGLAARPGVAAVAFALEVGLVVSLVGGLIASGVTVVETWADNLPPRHLGALGVFLLLLGFLLQSLQYWELLLGLTAM